MKKVWQENQNGNLHEEASINQPPNIILAKKSIHKSLRSANLQSWNDKVKNLVVQADFISPFVEENENVT